MPVPTLASDEWTASAPQPPAEAVFVWAIRGSKIGHQMWLGEAALRRLGMQGELFCQVGFHQIDEAIKKQLIGHLITKPLATRNLHVEIFALVAHGFDFLPMRKRMPAVLVA